MIDWIDTLLLIYGIGAALMFGRILIQCFEENLRLRDALYNLFWITALWPVAVIIAVESYVKGIGVKK